MDKSIIESAIDIFLPVLESSMVLAANYTNKCNRNCVTATDQKYALRFCARNMVGKHYGSLYPEIYEQEDDEEDESYIVDESEENAFTRYEGDDPILVQVNECYDTWDSWEPQNEAERMIKNAVDKYDI